MVENWILIGQKKCRGGVSGTRMGLVDKAFLLRSCVPVGRFVAIDKDEEGSQKKNRKIKKS